jgi:SAM-dependent methyltransferase
MSPPTDPALEKYRRLDDFLKTLHGDIYPEAPSGMHTSITRSALAKVRELYPIPEGAKVLDVGCGQGVALEMFREIGLDAVGITLGEDAEICRAKGLNVVEMDMAFLDFPDQSFDLVWCRHALEHSVFPLFTLHELHRVLKPGGVCYVEVPAPDTAANHQTNPNHYSVLGKSMWIELIRRAGFDRIKSFDLNLKLGLGPDVYWAFLQVRPA